MVLCETEVLTEGSCVSHSRQRSRSARIQAGCCDVCPLEGPAVEAVSSSSSVRVLILRNFPSNSLPATLINIFPKQNRDMHTLCNSDHSLSGWRQA